MVSIIIVCETIAEAERCKQECEKQKPYAEIIVVVGPGLPSRKRDEGIRKAKGDILAFIDADAYPVEDWLENALKRINDYAGVCGPGLLPPNSRLNERASDLILQRLPFNYRVKKSSPRFVDDYPSFNLILKRNITERIGGFSCGYLTGEDTLICQKITDLGHKILYTPDVAVYHNRRGLYFPLLRQTAIYAAHRGFFFKRYPKTSRRLVYCLPSLLLVSILLLVLSLLF